MKANIPTEIKIKEITIKYLDPDSIYTSIQVTCDIFPLGIAHPQHNATVTMSSELSPQLKEELCKILDRDMGIMVEHLQKEAK